ncbi:hypothetical protein TNCV_1220941 [Trichonephila clavipes]|nr:hypothetical protein TNCV_1220941 [Trichonephila clavipes]
MCLKLEEIFPITRVSRKPAANESHLVRDQNCIADDVGASNQELQYSFCVAVTECDLALTSNKRTPDLRSPGYFSRIASFDFGRVSQYRVALMVPTFKKSSNKTLLASHKTVRSPFPAKGVVLKFFRAGDDGFFHSIDVTFASGVKWWTYDSSLITIQNRKSLPSSW